MLYAISDWDRFAVRKLFGPVEWCDRPCDFENVELERGWTVGGFNGHFRVADFDARGLGCFVVARMIRSEYWCTRRCPAVIMRSEQMGLRSSWMDR